MAWKYIKPLKYMYMNALYSIFVSFDFWMVGGYTSRLNSNNRSSNNETPTVRGLTADKNNKFYVH